MLCVNTLAQLGGWQALISGFHRALWALTVHRTVQGHWPSSSVGAENLKDKVRKGLEAKPGPCWSPQPCLHPPWPGVLSLGCHPCAAEPVPCSWGQPPAFPWLYPCPAGLCQLPAVAVLGTREPQMEWVPPGASLLRAQREPHASELISGFFFF